MREGGDQRPFGILPKIRPLWCTDPSLHDYLPHHCKADMANIVLKCRDRTYTNAGSETHVLNQRTIVAINDNAAAHSSKLIYIAVKCTGQTSG